MNKSRQSILMAVILAAFWFARTLTPCAAAEKATVTVGWTTWEPFAYRDSSNQLVGLNIELLTAILTDAGYQFEFKEIPWKRQRLELEEGKLDISAGANKTAEREKFVYFSVPYQQEGVGFFVRKGETANYSAKTLADVIKSSMTVGVLAGTVYSDEYATLRNNPDFMSHLDEVSQDRQNHQKLLLKRIDGFIQEYSTLTRQEMDSGFLDQIEPLFTVSSEPLYFIVSQKTPAAQQIVEDINASLARLKADGMYQKIFEKYRLPANALRDDQ